MEDVKSFHDRFYSLADKVSQDNFILKFCSVGPVSRVRNPDSARPRSMAISYFVIKNKKLIPVCKNAFLGILNLKRYRIEGVLGRFLHKSEMPVENRGGDHKSSKNSHLREQIVEFIKSFAVLEKHYCRGTSIRQYISSDLTIKKMWDIFNRTHENYVCKLSYFREQFNTKFNIGFSCPQVDVCSTCLELGGKIKRLQNEEERKSLKGNLRLHKMKAKAYFDMLREEKQHILILSYDCEKNLVLPKIPDQITYYKRQLYLYNFTVVMGTSKSKLAKENVFMHTWLESQAPKGSNEIASAVYDTLKKLDIPDNITEIRLMSDGCAGQNKNTTMIGMCAKWFLEAPSHIKKIQLVFPITGHSFIPPDRVFGVIEKKIKKKDTIIDVQDYYDIFEQVGTVKKCGENWSVFEWKDEITNVLKPPSGFHFKISASKRIILTKGKNGTVLVSGEPNYNSSINNGRSICKRGKQIAYINPKPIELNKVKLNPKKIQNVNELLTKHFGATWKEESVNLNLDYYKTVIESAICTDSSDVEDESCFCEDQHLDSPEAAV